MRCPRCGGPLQAQPVYKHRWMVCARCGDAYRASRERLGVARLPASIQRRLPRALFANAALLDDPGRAFFDPKRYPDDRDVGTPYAGEADKVEARLAALGVDTGGEILDLSGGPGFVAQRLARRARRVVMTDYAAHAVAWARARLGVDAVRFDYAGAPLDAVVTGPFDLVLCRYSLNFCQDLPRLARGILAVTRPGATLVLDGFLIPTRGACLTSALEDIAPLALWTTRTVSAAFTDVGWRLISAFEPDPPMPYWRPRGRRYQLFSQPWAWAPGPLPRDLLQRHAGLLLRREGP